MRKLNELFKNKKIKYDSLIDYGFVFKNNIYSYEKYILNDEFKVIIDIDNDKDSITSKLIELAFNEEYLNADNEDAIGEYVGSIKEEYDKVIKDIITKCTIPDIFKNKQTKDVIKYIKSKYDDDLEFLWEKFDDNAIWRNKKNDKWYGLVLTVKGSRLGIDSNDTIEVIDLRYDKDKIDDIIDNKIIYPGYHMNKKSWITIKLDNSLSNKELFALIDNSYNLVDTPSEWVIPSNPNIFDVISYLNENDTVTWHQANNIHIGDIIYIYVGAPYSAIMYKCIVREVGVPSDWKHFKKAMTVDVLERYDKDKYPYSLLKECGVGFIRGPRTITKELSEKLNKC